MTVYNAQIAQAQRVIAKQGQLVTWVPENVSISGSQPWKTSPESDGPTYQVSIVFVPEGKGTLDALFHLIKGTSVPDGKVRGLMGAVPFVPAINDSVLRGTETLVVAAIDIVAPDGSPILYKLDFA